MSVNSVSKLLDKLDIVYYSYDQKNNAIVPDGKYSSNAIYNELVTITYHLTKKGVFFSVLKDKSILLKGKKGIRQRIKSSLELIKNRQKDKSIFIVSNKKVKGISNLTLSKIVYFNIDFDPSRYDALLLTSKNAFEALLKSKIKWKNIPFYVISEETAKLVKNFGGKVAYFSRYHHGNEFAKELEDKLEQKRVLYLRGEKVACDMGLQLQERGISCDSIIAYKNEYAPEEKQKIPPKNARIIFPSPSSIDYFLQAFSWDESYQVVCIGKTTLAALPQDIKGHMAKKTSFESCVQKAREI